jgi:carboxylesterase
MSIVFAFKQPRSAESEARDDGIYLEGTNGDAVLLIHGLTGTPTEMRFLGWFLHNHGYTVHCVRLANHGRPIGVLQATPWERFYGSVKDAHERLLAKHRRVFVAGLSMGALLALLLGAERGDAVSGISCLSPTLFYDGWNVPWYNALLRLAPYTGLESRFYFKESPPYGLKNERIRDRVHQFYAGARLSDMHDVDKFGYPFFPVSLLGQLRLLVSHVKARLHQVKNPCQVLQATEDDMSSVSNAHFIYYHVSSEIREIVYLEDSYHVITADQERGKVANAMLDFYNARRTHA